MTLDVLRDKIEDYYGEYKSKIQMEEAFKFIKKKVNYEKYDELWSCIVEYINPKFGCPTASQIKEAIKEAEKEGLTVLNSPLPMRYPEKEEHEEKRLFLYEEIACEKNPHYHQQFNNPKDYEEYLEYFHDGRDEYMILLCMYYDTLFVVRGGIDVIFPKRQDYEMSKKTTELIEAKEGIRHIRRYLATTNNPDFSSCCLFLVDCLPRRKTPVTTEISKAEALMRSE